MAEAGADLIEIGIPFSDPVAEGVVIQEADLRALASGTTAPTYISMREETDKLTAGTIIPVVRVLDSIIFETTFSASAASIKVGDKVTIHTDGLQVTATTTGGVAEVVWMEGTASGAKVRVRFPGVTAAAVSGGGGG